MNDPTPGHLQRLVPEVAEAAWWLIYFARINGIPLIVSSSLRSADEQRGLVLAGRSRTMNSAHLRGEAFDVDVAGLGRDFVPRWVWDAVGPTGEALGLVWGGRWRSFPDVGHFEARRPAA